MPKDNQQVIEVMTNQTTNIMAANAGGMLKALAAQIEDDEGSNKIVATIKVILEREGDVHGVSSSIKYSQAVQHEDSLDKVSIDPNQPDLPGVE